MKNQKGFTLIEYLIVIAVAALLLASNASSLAKLIEHARLQSTSADFFRALQLARTTAITRKYAVCVAGKNSSWNNGWQIFIDKNQDCVWDTDDELLNQHDSPPTSSHIYTTQNATEYILYLPTGESRQLNGAFMAASIYFCAASSSTNNERIVINRNGRIRRENIAPQDIKCRLNL